MSGVCCTLHPVALATAQPTAADLDTVSGDHPIALDSIDGHTMWANSEAMRRAGIDAAWPDPPGGMAVRDAAGNPTGILRETAQQPIDSIDGDDEEDLASALLAAQEHFLSIGLTAVTDLNGEEARAAYLSIKDAGKLKIRVVKGIPMYALESAIAEGRHTGDGDDWLRCGPVAAKHTVIAGQLVVEDGQLVSTEVEDRLARHARAAAAIQGVG